MNAISRRLVHRLRLFFNRQSNNSIITLSILGALAIGILDLFSGSRFSVPYLYLGPVIFAAWYGGRRNGVLLAIFSFAIMIAADYFSLEKFRHGFPHFLDETLRFLVILLIANLISSMKYWISMERIQARVDSLTGIFNRFAFFEAANREIGRARRYGRELTIAYIDIDNFKAVNDRWGHHEGDKLLRLTASVIRSSLRDADIFGRLGGDEFAILLPETKDEIAKLVLGKIQINLTRSIEKFSWPVNFSFGTHTFTNPPPSLDEMIRQADALMYKVKKSRVSRLLRRKFAA